MAINSKIEQSQWKDFFVSFSNGNRGREVTLEVYDAVSGSSGQAKQGPLMAIDYDPVGKGNDLVITTGVDEIEYSHTVPGPVEVWQDQADDGQVAALQIVDQNGHKTIVSF